MSKKVHPFTVPKPNTESFLFQEDKARSFYNKLHEHSEIQISYIVQGSGKLLAGDSIHPYLKGSAFVIGQNCPHVFQSDPSTPHSHMISLFFTKTSMEDSLMKLPELHFLRTFLEKSDAGFQLLEGQTAVQELLLQVKTSDKFSRILLFLRLIKKLSEVESNILTGFVYPKRKRRDGTRMQLIFEHVMNNFRDDIELATVAELAYMTPNAFCRYFKQRTRKTFFQFLIELRIEHACQLLASRLELSKAEIAERSGFKSISNFNRTFKKQKKMAPSDYQARIQLAG